MKPANRIITLFWLNLRTDNNVSLNYAKEIKRNKRRNNTGKPFNRF